jgi:hypothetical protein
VLEQDLFRSTVTLPPFKTRLSTAAKVELFLINLCTALRCARQMALHLRFHMV